jgi:hypothetical protein
MLFSIPLEGQWSFALDPNNRGEGEHWFARDLDDTITLPGSVDEAKKTPLTVGGTMAHLSRRHPYVGKAWYARTFEVAPGNEDHFYHLALERPHGEVNVWIDGYKLGRDDSLSTVNRLLIGKLSPGIHSIVLMIDNGRFEAVGEAIIRDNPIMGDVAHSKTEHTQTNWNGVVGYLRIEGARASIARVDIHASDRNVRLEVELDAFDANSRFPTFWAAAHRDELVAEFHVDGDPEPLTVNSVLTISSAFTRVTLTQTLPHSAALWDEFDPVVHRVTLTWLRDGIAQDRRESTFGIRHFARDGRRLTLNGRPVFLRGTLDCCIFPLTGYPPTDHAGWRKVFETAKAYGLNHIRYHSYCPPKAAFEVADDLGLLLHIESPVWPVLGADPSLDRYIHAEAERIMRDYGNHPSFVMFCVGNEVNGSGLHAFLERFIEDWKMRDSRRLYTGGSGWPTIERADYVSKPEPRNQRWDENLAGRLNARPLETLTDWSKWRDSVPMPLVSHETGQWCVFPDLTEIEKYTGVLEARNFIAVRDDLSAKGLLPLADDYLRASGALQAQLYKEEVEAALRTRDFAGTQLLGLQDFPGQGTALVGVVDAFWDEKPYISPARFSEFCAPIVPLIRTEKFVLSRDDSFAAQVQLAHYGPADLDSASLTWSLIGKGETLRSGLLSTGPLATGHLHDIGTITFPAAGLETPARYELVVALDGTDYRNRWGVWTMLGAATADLPLVTTLDRSTLDRIANGETIVFAPSPDAMVPNSVIGHTAAFWNTLWTGGQQPHTLGLLNDTTHGVFDHFPSDSHTDWHWWELTFHRRAFDMAGLAARAVVRVVDDWNTNRDLQMLSELRIGEGRLILCAFDLASDLANRPVARTFRQALAGYIAQASAEAPQSTPQAVLDWWQGVAA